MQAKCVRTAGMNLTHCKVYQILEQASHGKVEVIDDSGYRVWVDADCFVF